MKLAPTLCFVPIRGMVDEAGDQFVAYFLPTVETVGKRKRDQDMEQDYLVDEEWVTGDRTYKPCPE